MKINFFIIILSLFFVSCQTSKVLEISEPAAEIYARIENADESGDYLKSFTAKDKEWENHTFKLYDEEYLKYDGQIYLYRILKFQQLFGKNIGFLGNMKNIDSNEEFEFIFGRRILNSEGLKGYANKIDSYNYKNLSYAGRQISDGKNVNGKWVLEPFSNYFDSVFRTKNKDVEDINTEVICAVYMKK